MCCTLNRIHVNVMQEEKQKKTKMELFSGLLIIMVVPILMNMFSFSEK